MTEPVLIWFRQDLRLADNPALQAAIATEAPVIPLYILDETAPGDFAPGGAARWWLHQSLASLGADLTEHGSGLLLRRGDADLVLPAVIAETGARAVFWNRLYEPWAVRRDSRIKSDLARDGFTVESFNASLLFEPTRIRSGAGKPYRVFTPFWRACLAAPPPEKPLPAPRRLAGGKMPLQGDRLEDWQLLPTKPDWAGGLRASWHPGETGAVRALSRFITEALADYPWGRDRPDRIGTSLLSPRLQCGELSPRQVWHTVGEASQGAAADAFLRELGWREFCHHLLFACPELPTEPLDRRFVAFPWVEDGKGLIAWQLGQTGYPIVDAGMRQLWQTGWMHNRVRMIAASFLIKHLLQPWQAGERWFWDTLVDADLANNAASWQWVAGCGADAAPYFRIFNPVLQGQKFDPDGAYVRRFVPELAKLPDKFLHHPWDAPAAVLASAGVSLGRSYPRPIVDHREARQRALAAFDSIKSADAEPELRN